MELAAVTAPVDSDAVELNDIEAVLMLTGELALTTVVVAVELRPDGQVSEAPMHCHKPLS